MSHIPGYTITVDGEATDLGTIEVILLVGYAVDSGFTPGEYDTTQSEVAGTVTIGSIEFTGQSDAVTVHGVMYRPPEVAALLAQAIPQILADKVRDMEVGQ